MPTGVGFEQRLLQQILRVRGGGGHPNGPPTEGLKQRDHVTFEVSGARRILCQAGTFSTCERHDTFPSSHQLSVPTHVDRSALEPNRPREMSAKQGSCVARDRVWRVSSAKAKRSVRNR